MNHITLTRKALSILALSAREIDKKQKLEVVSELRTSVEELWHYLADLRQREVIDLYIYESYVKTFSRIRNIIDQKEKVLSS